MFTKSLSFARKIYIGLLGLIFTIIYCAFFIGIRVAMVALIIWIFGVPEDSFMPGSP